MLNLFSYNDLPLLPQNVQLFVHDIYDVRYQMKLHYIIVMHCVRNVMQLLLCLEHYTTSPKALIAVKVSPRHQRFSYEQNQPPEKNKDHADCFTYYAVTSSGAISICKKHYFLVFIIKIVYL